MHRAMITDTPPREHEQMATSAKLMTADELLEMPDDGSRYELIEGELVELVPPGASHGFVASNAGATLREFVRPRRLGAVFAAETGFVISTDPDTVRAPDAAFVASDRLPEGRLPSRVSQTSRRILLLKSCPLRTQPRRCATRVSRVAGRGLPTRLGRLSGNQVGDGLQVDG